MARSRYQITIDHENDQGNADTYTFHLRSVTARQVSETLKEYDEDFEAVEELIKLGISSASLNGQPMTDRLELPMEVAEEVMTKHPSFRQRNRTRRR